MLRFLYNPLTSNQERTYSGSAHNGFACRAEDPQLFGFDELAGTVQVAQPDGGTHFLFHWEAHGTFKGMNGENVVLDRRTGTEGRLDLNGQQYRAEGFEETPERAAAILDRTLREFAENSPKEAKKRSAASMVRRIDEIRKFLEPLPKPPEPEEAFNDLA